MILVIQGLYALNIAEHGPKKNNDVVEGALFYFFLRKKK